MSLRSLKLLALLGWVYTFFRAALFFKARPWTIPYSPAHESPYADTVTKSLIICVPIFFILITAAIFEYYVCRPEKDSESPFTAAGLILSALPFFNVHFLYLAATVILAPFTEFF